MFDKFPFVAVPALRYHGDDAAEAFAWATASTRVEIVEITDRSLLLPNYDGRLPGGLRISRGFAKRFERRFTTEVAAVPWERLIDSVPASAFPLRLGARGGILTHLDVDAHWFYDPGWRRAVIAHCASSRTNPYWAASASPTSTELIVAFGDVLEYCGARFRECIRAAQSETRLALFAGTAVDDCRYFFWRSPATIIPRTEHALLASICLHKAVSNFPTRDADSRRDAFVVLDGDAIGPDDPAVLTRRFRASGASRRVASTHSTPVTAIDGRERPRTLWEFLRGLAVDARCYARRRRRRIEYAAGVLWERRCRES